MYDIVIMSEHFFVRTPNLRSEMIGCCFELLLFGFLFHLNLKRCSYVFIYNFIYKSLVVFCYNFS